MNAGYYTLPVNPGAVNAARGWLKLAIASLILAGLFSLLLVLSRTPGVSEIIPWVDFFHTALVVHVDLSVVIWFLAFAGVFWSLTANPGPLAKPALWLTALGTGVLVTSPFLGAGAPLLNNYIPVLQHPLYFGALILIGLGVTLLVLHALFWHHRVLRGSVIGFATLAAAFVALLALLALVTSYLDIGDALQGQTYFEYLFWGSGHTLQFTHTILLLVAWLWLAEASGLGIGLNPKIARGLFMLLVLAAIAGVLVYYKYPVASPEHRIAFTRVMKYGGLAAAPLGLVVVLALWRGGRAVNEQRPLRAALIASIVLFTAGGVIGFLIEGVNVVIPAHYHGSIVGVTLAFTGIAYLLLPQLGYRLPMQRLATWQPYIYGGGQLLHILGLAWSGGYGVQRKTAGAAQGLDILQKKIGMGMMGLGGLIAVIGGIIFLVIMLKAMWPEKAHRGA